MKGRINSKITQPENVKKSKIFPMKTGSVTTCACGPHPHTTAIAWFKSYLNNRSSQVHISGKFLGVGGHSGCEPRIEVFVKIQKKKVSGGGGGGGAPSM